MKQLNSRCVVLKMYTSTTECRSKECWGEEKEEWKLDRDWIESQIHSQWSHLAQCRHESEHTISQLGAGHENCWELDHGSLSDTSLSPKCVVRLTAHKFHQK